MTTGVLLWIMFGLRVTSALSNAASAGAKPTVNYTPGAKVERFLLVLAFDICLVWLSSTTGYVQFELMVAVAWSISLVAAIATVSKAKA